MSIYNSVWRRIFLDSFRVYKCSSHTLTLVSPQIIFHHSSISKLAAKMIVLTLVRHGETKMNAAKIVQSRTPGELTERGIRMALSLGEKLKDEQFTRVYSSDLTRCHDTTINILKHSTHKQPDIQLTALLRERDYGDLEFQPVQLVLERVAAIGCPIHAVPLPGAETYEETVSRTAKFFDTLCTLADDAQKNENVLVVSHGTWIQCLIDYIRSNDQNFRVQNLSELYAKRTSPMNTSTTKMTIGKSIDSVREICFSTLYDASHLDALI